TLVLTSSAKFCMRTQQAARVTTAAHSRVLTRTRPALARLNIMRLHTSQSAVLATVIFNALIIITLVSLALRGVKYRPAGAASLLRRNVLVYGVDGIVAPFPGIWILDQLLVWLHLAYFQ